MELKQLTYFCELMREKNITRAAGRLFLTHQALSLSISKLEEELGVPLFLRSQQGVEPTLYAEILYRHAKAVEEELASARAEISRITCPGSEQVRLAFSYATVGEEGSFFRQDALMRHIDGRYELIFHESYSTDCLESLENGNCDLAIALGPYKKELLTGIRLGRMKTLVMISQKNPLAQKKVLSLKDLREEPFLFPMVQDIYYQTILKKCRRCGFEPNIRYLNMGTPSILKKVENNAGVWLVMQTIEHLYGSDSIAVLPLDKETDIVLDLHLLYRKDKPLTPQAIDLYQYLSRRVPAPASLCQFNSDT